MRLAFLALVTAALVGCGGDEVKFDLNSPPPWLRKLDASLPAKRLSGNELAGGCVGTEFVQCTARVNPSRAMTRKAQFALRQGKEVRITYSAEGANPVTITLRPDKKATVPVRKNGGTLTFRCRGFDRCAIDLL
jgi:hypothetical protein